MKTLVPFLIAFFTLGKTHAQFTQNFEGTESSLTDNCWSLSGIFRTTDPLDILNGTASMTTNPPVNNGGREIITPLLNVNTTSITITFNYKISSLISGNATRTIEIGLYDMSGNYTSLDMVTMDKFTPATVQTYNNTRAVTVGLYRLVLKLAGANGDGSCRIVFDDLATTCNAKYGNGTCNSAPIAINDVFLGTVGNAISGCIVTNDNEPDGEIMTPSIISNSNAGVLTLNANGTFLFVPNAGWNGSSTSFTYRLSDNGYSPMISNTATVTLNFVVGSPLPVKMTSFTATLNNNNAMLKWTTSSEINVNHYVVERSVDGVSYSNQGMVLANGSANSNTAYEFPDNLATVTARVVYYRIRSVDMDGKSELSETRLVRLDKGATSTLSIQVYPNPATDEVRVTIPTDWQDRKVAYEIFSAIGVPVRKTLIAGNSQTETIKLNGLSSGVYFIRVSCEGQSLQQAIVKH